MEHKTAGNARLYRALVAALATVLIAGLGAAVAEPARAPARQARTGARVRVTDVRGAATPAPFALVREAAATEAGGLPLVGGSTAGEYFPEGPLFPAQTRSRPRLQGERKLATDHFVVHYSTRGSDAPPDGDANGDGVPDYVEKVSGAFEASWAVQIDGAGWAAPPPDRRRGGDDRFDAYVVSFSARDRGGVLGEAVPEGPCGDNPNTADLRELSGCPGYMMVDAGLRSDLDIGRVVGHEFLHNVQFGYVADPDWSQQEFNKVIWLYESCARWMEQFQFADMRVPADTLRCFLSDTDVNMNEPTGQNCGRLYRYSSFIFFQFLAERFGPDVVRQIWRRAARERIFDDAVWLTIEEYGDSFPNVWRDFSIALYTFALCDGSGKPCFARGSEYRRVGRVRLEDAVVLGPRPRKWTSKLNGNGRLDGQAADYIAVESASDFRASLTMGADPRRIAFAALRSRPGGAFEIEVAVAQGRSFTLELRRAGPGELTLMIANGGQTRLLDYTLELSPIEDLPTPSAVATRTPTPTLTVAPTGGPTGTPTPSPTSTGSPTPEPSAWIYLPWSGRRHFHAGR